MSEVRERLKVNRPRCPYCHDEIAPGGAIRACHGCLTWHHQDCWEIYGSCVTCGIVPALTADPVKQCKHEFSKQDYSCYHCGVDMAEVYSESYVESYIDKQVDDAYLDELIVCKSPRCEEPATRRQGGICSLCNAEYEVWGDTRAEGGMSSKERHDAIIDYEAMTETSLSPPISWAVLMAIVIIVWAIYLVSSAG